MQLQHAFRKGLHDGGGTGSGWLRTTSAATAARGPSTDLVQSKPGVELENQAKAPLRLLVISDPHVQPPLPESNSSRESWWVLGNRQIQGLTPSSPCCSCSGRMSCNDSLMRCCVPGDICHKASPAAAFRMAWERFRLLAHELGGIPLVGTLGNHDVMSRTAGASGPFGFAKTRPDFPGSAESTRRDFWEDGSAIASLAPDWDIVLINTAHHHYSEALARTGTFDTTSVLSYQEDSLIARAPLA